MDAMQTDDSATATAGPSRSPTPLKEPTYPAQPAFFYPGGHNSAPQIRAGDFVSPDQDPFATRGIPVFKPTHEEFRDFEKYMERVEPWGRKSGIVKIIPPAEWSNALPPVNSLLPGLKLKNPIEQHMIGQSGLFRQSNVEKRRTLSLKDWADLCNKPELRPNPIKDGAVQTRGIRQTPKKPAKRVRKAKKDPKDDDVVEQTSALPDEEGHQPNKRAKTRSPSASNETNPPHDAATETESKDNDRRSASPEAAQTTEDPFFASFDPKRSWLPEGTHPEDYSPEVCRELERVYWRSCGLGTPPLYGADMAGSLFTEETKEWNVANLPSFLSRLCKNKAIPGVNTPYLYFGMWRATFAWHVEDMDLYSINYIHWGAPKYWYAIPSGRSKAFESVMKGLFPGDATGCPQYLRHKSYLASPTLLAGSSCRPNTLVQHQGEFVITYPRGYHAGFNLGLNCAESVNFALDSWIELGRKAGVCTCVGDSVRIDVDALLNSAEEQREEERSALEKERKRKRGEETGEETASEQPKRIKKITIRFDPKAEPSAHNTTPDVDADPSPDSKRRGKAPPVAPPPCCLCPSVSEDGLLRVHTPPPSSASARPFILQDANAKEVPVWRAHEKCALVIPDTWVDELNGEKLVFGVDTIDKDRWALRCSVCVRGVLKSHGAKIQCTRPSCTKAFHVSCAATCAEMVYKELPPVEKDIVVLDSNGLPQSLPEANTSSSQEGLEEPTMKVVRRVKKLPVETLCRNHNPATALLKKQAKADQMRQDALALKPEDRIKVRAPAGIYEVMVVKVDPARESIHVAWGTQFREFAWKHVVWGDVAPGTIIKKVEEEWQPPANASNRLPTAAYPPSAGAPRTAASAPSLKVEAKPPSVPTSSTKTAAIPYGYPYLTPQYPGSLQPSAYPYASAYTYYRPPPAYPPQLPGQSSGTPQTTSQPNSTAPQWPPYTQFAQYPYAPLGAYYSSYPAYPPPHGHPQWYTPAPAQGTPSAQMISPAISSAGKYPVPVASSQQPQAAVPPKPKAPVAAPPDPVPTLSGGSS